VEEIRTICNRLHSGQRLIERDEMSFVAANQQRGDNRSAASFSPALKYADTRYCTIGQLAPDP